MTKLEDDLDGAVRNIFLDVLGFAVTSVVLVAMILIVLALLTSCQTYTAIVEAPESFWITLEDIVVALVDDIIAIVEFIL